MRRLGALQQRNTFFQIRSFISTNVALSFTGGFVVGLVDDNGFAVDGTPVGVAGVHYYFF